MTAEPAPDVPEEISVTDARKVLGELADAANNGRVIYLTKHGQRIAKIQPATSEADVNEAFVAGAREIIERNREMFDRLAEL